MPKETIYTKNAPEPIGPYSQAVEVSTTSSNLLFTSGQIPIDSVTGNVVSGGIKEQTRQVILNIKAILEEDGLTLNNVVKTTVFMKDMNDFAAMNEVYAEFFGSSKPARSTVEVARLPKDVLVEIETISFV